MSLSDGGVQATMPVAPTGMMNSGFGGFGGDGALSAPNAEAERRNARAD